MSNRQRMIDLAEGRANHFDALRLLLASLVIFSHSYPLLLGSNESEPICRATGGQRTAGEIAVDGFFLMSGFLITASWMRNKGLGDYLRRRVQRIYPGFLVAVLFTGLVAAPLLASSSAEYWKQFNTRRFVVEALNLSGAATPGRGANGSLWSIRYEFCCYLAVAGMGLIGMLRRRPLVLAASVGCTALHAAQLHLDLKMPGSRLSWLWCYPGFWPRLSACFLTGAVFYLYRDRVVCSGRLALTAAVGLVVAAGFPAAQGLPLLFPVLGGYLLLYLAFVPESRLQNIARWGDLSYGLYLYAFPIQLLLIQSFGNRLTPPALTGLALIATAVMAALSWRLVERPCMRWRSGKPLVAAWADRLRTSIILAEVAET
jgi:peptidoglycan/LPS O-acetylase OafA/YrhL